MGVPGANRCGVKVRIKVVPREPEMDGVSLDTLRPGSVREVSASIGTWLMAQGYAELEMRHQLVWPDVENKHVSFSQRQHLSHDRRRRRKR